MLSIISHKEALCAPSKSERSAQTHGADCSVSSFCTQVAAEALAEASKTPKNQQLAVVLSVTPSQSQAQPPKRTEPALSGSAATDAKAF